MSYFNDRPVECTLADFANLDGHPIEVPALLEDVRANVGDAYGASLSGLAGIPPGAYMVFLSPIGSFNNVNLFFGGISDLSNYYFFPDVMDFATTTGQTSFCRDGRPLSSQEVTFIWGSEVSGVRQVPDSSVIPNVTAEYAAISPSLTATGIDICLLTSSDVEFTPVFAESKSQLGPNAFCGKLLLREVESPVGSGTQSTDADVQIQIDGEISAISLPANPDETDMLALFDYRNLVGLDPVIEAVPPTDPPILTLADYNARDNFAVSYIYPTTAGDPRFCGRYQPSFTIADVKTFFGLP